MPPPWKLSGEPSDLGLLDRESVDVSSLANQADDESHARTRPPRRVTLSAKVTYSSSVDDDDVDDFGAPSAMAFQLRQSLSGAKSDDTASAATGKKTALSEQNDGAHELNEQLDELLVGTDMLSMWKMKLLKDKYAMQQVFKEFKWYMLYLVVMIFIIQCFPNSTDVLELVEGTSRRLLHQW